MDVAACVDDVIFLGDRRLVLVEHLRTALGVGRGNDPRPFLLLLAAVLAVLEEQLVAADLALEPLLLQLYEVATQRLDLLGMGLLVEQELRAVAPLGFVIPLHDELLEQVGIGQAHVLDEDGAVVVDLQVLHLSVSRLRVLVLRCVSRRSRHRSDSTLRLRCRLPTSAAGHPRPRW